MWLKFLRIALKAGRRMFTIHTKPKENHGKQIEISSGSWLSWNAAGGKLQLKVLRKLKENLLGKVIGNL